MTEGVVAKWHAKLGDTISEGMLLAEIETDKATMDFEAFPGQEGVLLHIGVHEGQTAPDLVAELQKQGVLAYAIAPNRVRLVTHLDVARPQIEETLRVIHSL